MNLKKLFSFFRNIGSDHRNKVRDAVQVTQALKKAVDSKTAFFIAAAIPGRFADKARNALSVALGTILKDMDAITGVLAVSHLEAKSLAESRPFNEIAAKLLVSLTDVDLEVAKQQVELDYQTSKDQLTK